RYIFFFFQAEDGIRDGHVTGVQTCALPISSPQGKRRLPPVFGSKLAAISHSASVGSRRRAHLHHASASHQLTQMTGCQGRSGTTSSNTCSRHRRPSATQNKGRSIRARRRQSHPWALQTSRRRYPPSSTKAWNCALVTGVEL